MLRLFLYPTSPYQILKTNQYITAFKEYQLGGCDTPSETCIVYSSIDYHSFAQGSGTNGSGNVLSFCTFSRLVACAYALVLRGAHRYSAVTVHV